MNNQPERKLQSIELYFEDGTAIRISSTEIQKMNEVGKHLQEINKAIDTAKWLVSLRAEP